MLKNDIKKLIDRKEAKVNELKSKAKSTEDIAELRALNEDIDDIIDELAELKRMYGDADKPADRKPVEDVNVNVEEGRALDPVAAMKMSNGKKVEKKVADQYDTPEYRAAFMEFCKNGTPIPAEFRGDAITTTTDASAVVPTTLLNEIVQSKSVYGNLYDEVRHLNVQGGVDIPILTLKPTATWITADTGTSESDLQKLESKTNISFSYYGLECKVAQTLLVNVTSISAFEALFVELATEAMRKALDIAIMNGTGSGEPTGITVDTRVPAGNVIELTAADMQSWHEWKAKVFAKMKKAYRNGKFYMSQATFDGYIDGMVDSVGQPIGRVNYGIEGDERYRFGGKIVDTVEDDVLPSFDDASDGDVIAVFLEPKNYAVNTNMEMRTERWIDHDTNTVKNKVILIADGKLIDPNGVLVIKKSV